jgi:hypothetical protein
LDYIYHHPPLQSLSPPLTLIEVAALTPNIPHLVTVYFLATTLFPGLPKGNLLSHSSAEVEYRGVAKVVSETCWVHNLLPELHFHIPQATLVYCDNVSAIYLSGNPVQHQRTKHIEMDIHFVPEKVARGQAHILHVPSRHQITDIFTKGLHKKGV